MKIVLFQVYSSSTQKLVLKTGHRMRLAKQRKCRLPQSQTPRMFSGLGEEDDVQICHQRFSSPFDLSLFSNPNPNP